MGKRWLAVGLTMVVALAVGCGHAKKDVGTSGRSSADDGLSGGSSNDGGVSRGTRASKDGGAYNDAGTKGGGYHKLVVFARFADPASRSDAERAFVRRLRDKGVEGVGASTILASPDTVPNNEIDRAVKRSGADGVVFVNMADQKTASASSGSTRTQAVVYMPRDRRAGSYYLSLPVVYYDVELIDCASGKPAWTYNGQAGANTYAKFDDLIASVASKSVESMRKAHAIQKADKNGGATRPRRVNPN